MNIVYILSDRHNAEFAGCYGSPITRTPHIDSIAERGTRFEHAYCISPLCTPSRAALFSGRYVHEIGTWDCAFPYTGTPRGWSHFFAEQGVDLVTIGKLDFHPDPDYRIADARLASYRENLNVFSLFREQDMPPRYLLIHRLRASGPSDTPQPFEEDDRVAEDAVRWLTEEAPTDRSWILNVNFLKPLPVWTPPGELWDYYDPLVRLEDLDERYREDPSRLHLYHRAFIRHTCGDLMRPEDLRRAHVGIHGTCEAVDRNVGLVLHALEQSGLADETLVVYTSDHGGCAGDHGDWCIGSMYEGSIRVPLVVAGPGLRSGRVETAPVSHHDLFQTFCDALDLEHPVHMRGTSLWDLLQGKKDASKPAFTLSEYHAAGFPSSIFAIRSGHDKYVENVGERPSLFDLEQDPLEMHDLVLERPEDPDVKATIRRLRMMLCEVCSPEAVDARAKADQRRLRRKLTDNGRMVQAMWRLGFQKNPEYLIPREELKPEDGQEPTP